MKQLYFYFLVLLPLISFSQIRKDKENQGEAAWFINSRLVTSKTMEGIDPKDVENLAVKKGDTLITGKKFHGKIFVTLRNNKDYEFLSLNDIKKQYTDVKTDNVLYMVNGNFIKDKEEYYFIEKSYFFKAIDQSRFNPYLKEKGIVVINILTKTPANLNAKIIIRGNGIEGIE